MNFDRIVLTTDADVLAKLRRKLAEYDERYSFQAPEIRPLDTYKTRLLKELLDQGSIDVALRRAHASAEDSFYHAGSFDTALKIVAAYNANDLTQVRGGTGLR